MARAALNVTATSAPSVKRMITTVKRLRNVRRKPHLVEENVYWLVDIQTSMRMERSVSIVKKVRCGALKKRGVTAKPRESLVTEPVTNLMNSPLGGLRGG